jgi:GNAT superfamily N-acetyltransferase
MTTPQSNFVVRTTDEADWEHVRALRLEMLRDTPIGYGEAVNDALGRTAAEWRVRAARGQQPHGTSLVAITADGRWVGAMAGYVDDQKPRLVGVYVTPSHRGRDAGVTDALLAGIGSWARQHGGVLWLEVHEDNRRAITAYERRQFRRTGATRPYDLDPSRVLIEMSKTL